MDPRIERSLSELAPDRRELVARLVARGEADPRDARYVGLFTALKLGDLPLVEAWADAIEGGEPYGRGEVWRAALEGFEDPTVEDED